MDSFTSVIIYNRLILGLQHVHQSILSLFKSEPFSLKCAAWTTLLISLVNGPTRIQSFTELKVPYDVSSYDVTSAYTTVGYNTVSRLVYNNNTNKFIRVSLYDKTGRSSTYPTSLPMDDTSDLVLQLYMWSTRFSKRTSHHLRNTRPDHVFVRKDGEPLSKDILRNATTKLIHDILKSPTIFKFEQNYLGERERVILKESAHNIKFHDLRAIYANAMMIKVGDGAFLPDTIGHVASTLRNAPHVLTEHYIPWKTHDLAAQGSTDYPAIADLGIIKMNAKEAQQWCMRTYGLPPGDVSLVESELNPLKLYHIDPGTAFSLGRDMKKNTETCSLDSNDLIYSLSVSPTLDYTTVIFRNENEEPITKTFSQYGAFDDAILDFDEFGIKIDNINKSRTPVELVEAILDYVQLVLHNKGDERRVVNVVVVKELHQANDTNKRQQRFIHHFTGILKDLLTESGIKHVWIDPPKMDVLDKYAMLTLGKGVKSTSIKDKREQALKSVGKTFLQDRMILSSRYVDYIRMYFHLVDNNILPNPPIEHVEPLTKTSAIKWVNWFLTTDFVSQLPNIIGALIGSFYANSYSKTSKTYNESCFRDHLSLTNTSEQYVTSIYQQVRKMFFLGVIEESTFSDGDRLFEDVKNMVMHNTSARILLPRKYQTVNVKYKLNSNHNTLSVVESSQLNSMTVGTLYKHIVSILKLGDYMGLSEYELSKTKELGKTMSSRAELQQKSVIMHKILDPAPYIMRVNAVVDGLRERYAHIQYVMDNYKDMDSKELYSFGQNELRYFLALYMFIGGTAPPRSTSHISNLTHVIMTSEKISKLQQEYDITFIKRLVPTDSSMVLLIDPIQHELFLCWRVSGGIKTHKRKNNRRLIVTMIDDTLSNCLLFYINNCHHPDSRDHNLVFVTGVKGNSKWKQKPGIIEGIRDYVAAMGFDRPFLAVLGLVDRIRFVETMKQLYLMRSAMSIRYHKGMNNASQIEAFIRGVSIAGSLMGMSFVTGDGGRTGASQTAISVLQDSFTASSVFHNVPPNGIIAASSDHFDKIVTNISDKQWNSIWDPWTRLKNYISF